MTYATRVLLLIPALALGLGACASRVQVAHRTPNPAQAEPAAEPATDPAPAEPATDPAPAEPAPTPTSGVPVEVAIASVTLGDDCPAPETAPPAAAQPVAQDLSFDAPSAGAPARPANGRMAHSFCRRTGLQLSVSAPEHHPGGVLEVLEVRLLRMDNTPVATLEVRGQTRFEDGAYVAWDGAIAPGEQNVSLHTGGPDWPAIGGDQRGYGQSYRVEVDVRVGGETRTIEMAPVSREPMIVT